MSDYFQDTKDVIPLSISQEPLNNKDEYGQSARDALTNLRTTVNKLKAEGKKLGTEHDNKDLRHAM